MSITTKTLDFTLKQSLFDFSQEEIRVLFADLALLRLLVQLCSFFLVYGLIPRKASNGQIVSIIHKQDESKLEGKRERKKTPIFKFKQWNLFSYEQTK